MHWSNENKTELRDLVKRELSWEEIADHFSPWASQSACQAQANRMQINSPERLRPHKQVGRPPNRRKSVAVHMRLAPSVVVAFKEVAALLHKRPGKLLTFALECMAEEREPDIEGISGCRLASGPSVAVCWGVPQKTLHAASKKSGLSDAQTGVAAVRALLTSAGYTLESK